MKLSVIIINYRSEEDIFSCLDSIRYDRPYEIIVIDNEGNKKVMTIMKKYRRVKVIPFIKNLGFAEGNNKAIREAKGEYILCINADATLEKNYISRCIHFLDTHKQYSSVQGKYYLDNKKGKIDSTGNILTTSGFAYNANHKDKEHPTPSGEVFGVCAAAAIYRKKALEDVKVGEDYFDSDFFAYLEDVDLDYRLRLFGHKAYFLTTATAIHKRETTSTSTYRFKQALKNRYFLVLKNSPPLKMAINLIFYFPVLLFLPKRIRNIKLIPKMLEKRKYIQQKKVISYKEMKQWIQKTPWHRWIRLAKLIRLAQ